MYLIIITVFNDLLFVVLITSLAVSLPMIRLMLMFFFGLVKNQKLWTSLNITKVGSQQMAKKGPKVPPKETSPTVTKGKATKNDPRKAKDEKSPQLPQNERPASTQRPSSGKTPISLLHEHAQRQKWEKVQYDMHKVKGGMVATAILGWVEPKTKEVITVKIKHNLKPNETTIEARFFAATVALHRVCFNKSLHMVLPREFKDVWAELEDERKALLKENKHKHDSIYANEPFKVVLELRKVQQSREKEYQAKINNESKVKKSPIVLTSVNKSTVTASSSTKTSTKRSLPELQERIVKFPKKVWESAPTFNFTINERELIQKSIRSQISWKRTKNPNSSQISKQALVSLGFRESHVDEALKYQDSLSFLLFNVPDDDLPAFFVDSTAADVVTVADKNEILLKRVAEFGISRNEALYFLNRNDVDLRKTIVDLTGDSIDYDASAVESEINEATSLEIWKEEIDSLSMIYEENKITVLSDESVMIKIDEFLSLTVFKSDKYPYDLVGFIISTCNQKYKLPNYVKMKLNTTLAHYTTDSLIGDSYIFSLVDWLQQNSAEIIENPGSLLDVKLEKQIEALEVTPSSNIKERKFFRSNPNISNIKLDYEKRSQSKEFLQMLTQRQKLPAWEVQNDLINTINSNSISLITGETGSGKSTQLVQFILDDLYSKGDYKTQILCTQPRRISAIGLAERVASERAAKCGEEVGYIIRGANKTSRDTKIKFLTTGIFVKFLQNSDDFLNNTILVIDEVHERSMETDLIIIMIKKLLRNYKNMKIVLMSATVDVSSFKSYFKGLETAHIKGRTFPIEDFYLDDVLSKTDFKIRINDEWIAPKPDSKFFETGNINYDLIASLVDKVDDDLVGSKNNGSILIFLPGVAEINKCIKILQQRFQKPSVILPLHSALSTQEQSRVFETFYGKRKIIASTNIAETSITINDCVVTIDSGRVKAVSYNAVDNTTRLVESFESKAEAKQRRGRAGRVSNGISYKLFTKDTHETMLDAPIPEMKRINLDSLYLVVKSMGIKDVIGFLDTAMDPPPLGSLVKSEEILKCSGFVDEYDDLTELGKYASLLPIIDPKHGKLIIFSIIFGCVDFGVLVASVLGVGSPFLKSHDLRDKIKGILSQTKELGDLLSIVFIVQKYFSIESSSEKKQFLNNNYLSYTKLNEIKSSKAQLLSIIEDLGFIPLKYKEGNPDFNKNHKNLAVIKAIITGSFYPQVARVQLPDPKFLATSSGSVQVDPDAKLIKYWIRNEQYITQLNKSEKTETVTPELPATRTFIHPSSVLFDTSIKEIEQKDFEELKSEREDGLIEFEKLQQRKVDMTPSVKTPKTQAMRAKFITYNSSHLANKLYLRDITPTSTLSVLLFGGPLSYDLSTVLTEGKSPGIVLDSWLPVKTWCKNAVLIKELRYLVDEAIRDRLENPSYSIQKESTSTSKSSKVLQLLDDLLSAANR